MLDGIVTEQEGRLTGQGRRGQQQGQEGQEGQGQAHEQQQGQAGADVGVEIARAHAGAHGHPGGGVRRWVLGWGWVYVAALALGPGALSACRSTRCGEWTRVAQRTIQPPP